MRHRSGPCVVSGKNRSRGKRTRSVVARHPQAPLSIDGVLRLPGRRNIEQFVDRAQAAQPKRCF
jgi:hypothetical protein